MDLCGDDELATLVVAIERDNQGDLAVLDAMLARFPQDARLHFMRGSILAGRRQALEAHAALARSVELAPEFHLARYQLGFFELTSGEVDEALATWGPLLRLPEDSCLRLFVEGLTHLVRDEFAPAIARLQEGIEINLENAPLNGDIRLLIAECRKALGSHAAEAGEASKEEDRSATSVILGQFSRPAGD
jgi:tetratricopeptide (TPR) repeat protein